MIWHSQRSPLISTPWLCPGVGLPQVLSTFAAESGFQIFELDPLSDQQDSTLTCSTNLVRMNFGAEAEGTLSAEYLLFGM